MKSLSKRIDSGRGWRHTCLWAFVLFQAREKLGQEDSVVGIEETEVEITGPEDSDGKEERKKEDSELSHLDDGMELSAIKMEDQWIPLHH